MPILSQNQSDRAIAMMREYLAAPRNPSGSTPREVQRERDQKRVKLIEAELKPLVTGYLAGAVSLLEFKTQVDGINKRHSYWGFRGIKGQMFFNMITNVAGEECDDELKAVIGVPRTEEDAQTRIRGLASYVTQLGDRHVQKGGSNQGRPKVGSVPFFLSYFWQVQERSIWPVFYTNTVNTLSDQNLWQRSGDLAEDYLTYKHLHEELAALFTQASGEEFGLYEVEHVFWFKGGNPFGDDRPLPKPSKKAPQKSTLSIVSPMNDGLPEGYVPPVVAILPAMARCDPKVHEAAKKAGTSGDRAFEKSVNAAFTVLGYDTQLLGQGQGRVPDGQALSIEDEYAILWDAKGREKGYSMGTDDRAIQDYVEKQSKELRRNRTIRNIYYVIVSSSFLDDFDSAVRSLKMRTEVNEVVLLEADALVEIVDARLRNPREITLGPDGVQRLLSSSGIVGVDEVRELLG